MDQASRNTEQTEDRNKRPAVLEDQVPRRSSISTDEVRGNNFEREAPIGRRKSGTPSKAAKKVEISHRPVEVQIFTEIKADSPMRQFSSPQRSSSSSPREMAASAPLDHAPRSGLRPRIQSG